MEAPEPTCPAPPARHQPAPAPGPPGAPGGQASPRLTLGPILLPPEQGLAPTVFLKALPIPLYHTVPPGGLQPRAPLVTGSLDGGGVPFLLSPLLQPEGPSVAQVGKPTASTLTVSLVGALPVLSPGSGPTLGSPGKVRNASKYLCPHCGRDCLKPSVLEKHIRSHTGERPFPCAACGIAFKTQSNLYKHRRTQTHLNNSRLSSESEGAGAGLLQEADKAGETSRAGTGEGASERPPLGARLPLGAKDLEAVSRPGSTPADREVPPDSAHAACPGFSLVSTQPRRPQPEQKPCSLQRQQATASEKPWDAKGSEGRLRKCESTDSGYLSRSDSAEQPPPLSSPLHSLSEHSTESEGEGAPGPGPGGLKTEPRVPGASLELEKKRLEERITQLISRNQALVDDPQLDHVRPRKTVLSKQGSIDLPTPYTFKGSFHFDIRALEPGRRRAALGPARSTLTSLDKSRPLFFHSVPTQLSTTVECVPVTRSNSLPLVEGSRTWPEPANPQDTCPSTLSPGSPRPTPARLGYRAGLTLADIPGGHPRALVRQAAVEDLPCTPAGDTLGPEEDTAGKRTAPGEGTASKGRAAGRRGSQRRLEMFSQEKWQVYGHETFKRLYQKMKSSHHGGQRAREGRGAGTTAPDLPLPREEAAAGEGAAQSQDRKSPVPGHVSMGAKQGPWASGSAPDGALGSKSPKQREEVAGAGGSEQCRAPRAGSPPTLDSTALPCLGSRSPLFPPNGRLEPGQQPPLVPGPLQQGDLEASRLVLPDLKPEAGACSGGGVEETGPWAHAVLRWPSRGSGEPQLPSERKKPKVEGPGSLETLATETLGAPAGATSPRSRKQDGDLGETPGKPHGSAGRVGEALESPGTSSAAPPAAPRDKESPLRVAAGAPGPCPMAAPQPRAVVHNAFPPKYLLRLPQRETPTPLPGIQGPLQGRDPACRIAGPKELASVVAPPLTPSPAAGPTPGEAGGISEDHRWCRPCAGRKEEQGGEQEGARTHAGIPAAEQSPEAAPGTSGVTATCASSCAQAVEGETLATHHPCPSASTKPSGNDPDHGAPTPGLGGPPGTSPEASPLGPRAEPKLHCPLQSSSFPTVPGWPELALSPHSGTPRSSRAHSPFPSLRAEPRLTWCCLSRSVPLPVEQEKSSSVYLALHFPGGGPQDEGPDPSSVSGEGWSRTRPGGGGGGRGSVLALASKLSHPMVPGVMAQHPLSEPEQKKGPPQRRTRMWRGNSKQKKLRINPKRYRGEFLHSQVPPRARRLRGPPWVLTRSCRPPPLGGTLGQASPDTAGPRVPGEPPCATSELPLCCGDEEKAESNCGQIPRTSAPSSSSRAAQEAARSAGKALSPSAGEPGDCRPLQADACLAVAQDDLVPQSRGLDSGVPETQPLPSLDQVPADPVPRNCWDTPEPSSSGPDGASPGHDAATSGSICASPGARAAHNTLGVCSAETQDHSWTAGETDTQSSPGRKSAAENASHSSLSGKPLSEQTSAGSAPLGSTGKIHGKISTSGPSSTSLYQEEGRPKTYFPSRGQCGCGEMATPGSSLGNDVGKGQGPGLAAGKGSVVPSNPGQPADVPEGPCKSSQKGSLEGMRKQTRVELSDTSSDDEDRLVIEI